MIVLGDVFDRGGIDADPVGVFFALSGIQGKYTWIRGIDSLPLQKELEVDGVKYLFAHAMTSPVGVQQNRDYYLMGTYDLDTFIS